MPDEYGLWCPGCGAASQAILLHSCPCCDWRDEEYYQRLRMEELGALRKWRVTVTLEYTIDRSDHDCDPDVCPLESTVRKRLTFKKVKARAEWQAEERALDRFEIVHKVPEGGVFWADARLLVNPAVKRRPTS
jgi:hypothetical protein